MKYLDIIGKSKYKDFYLELLEYMFEKFELDSEEAEEWAFELLKWDLNEMDKALDIGIDNGYSLEMQMSISKYAFNKELGIEKIQNEEERKILESILERYSEGYSKNS